jgi:hypothetical protein
VSSRVYAVEYANVCRCMLTYAGGELVGELASVCVRMLPYADVCCRMLPYAALC